MLRRKAIQTRYNQSWWLEWNDNGVCSMKCIEIKNISKKNSKIENKNLIYGYNNDFASFSKSASQNLATP